jgi:hypothetical protein
VNAHYSRKHDEECNLKIVHVKEFITFNSVLSHISHLTGGDWPSRCSASLMHSSFPCLPLSLRSWGLPASYWRSAWWATPLSNSSSSATTTNFSNAGLLPRPPPPPLSLHTFTFWLVSSYLFMAGTLYRSAWPKRIIYWYEWQTRLCTNLALAECTCQPINLM